MSDHHSALFPASADPVGAGLTGRDLWRQVFKHGAVILGSAVTVTALVWVALWRQPAAYPSTVKVWVKTEQQGYPSFLSGVAAYREGMAIEPANRKLETEMQLLLAQPNLEAVVRQLHITRRDLPAGVLSGLLGGVKLAKDPEEEVQATVEVLQELLKVEPARSKTADTSSNLLSISLATHRAELTPQILHALVARYQRYGIDQNQAQGRSSQALIQDKLQAAQAEIAQIDKRLLQLTAAQGAKGSAAAADGATQALALPDDGRPGLRLDTMLGSMRAGGSSALAALKQQAVAQQAKVEELRQLYTDDAELVRNAKRQLALTEGRLQRSVQASAQLDASLAQLERARTFAQDRFNELRRKLDQIELYLASSQDETATRVLTQTARAATKPERKKQVVLAVLAPMLGVALGLLLAALRAYFDHRLASADEVRRHLGMDTLAVLPLQRKAQP